MTHFPPEFIDEVLSRTDLVELISRHLQLKKAGSNLMGLCPFHHEKSPSFSVSPDKQLYYCFGCGKGGGAFQFLMEHDGYSFPEAVEYLAEKAGLEVPRDARSDSGEAQRHAQALQLLEQAAAAFSRVLQGAQGKAARDYLVRRGMPEAIVRDYRIGFAPPGYDFMKRCFGQDGRVMAQLEAVGLLFKNRQGGYGDRFRDRVMFPIRDRRGKVVGFGGRILGDGEPKYLNSPETPYFHKSNLLYGFSEHREQIRKRKLLLVVEGYMDVLALAAHGFPIGLAPLGTAITESQIREILRLHDAPIFCFDGDRAGRQAAWRALERMLPLLGAEHAPRFLYLPEGEDPDSLLGREGGEAFAARIEREARPVLETWLTGLKLLAGQGAEGRARMAKKADAMLETMADVYLKQAWKQEAERATGISLQAVTARTESPRPARPAGLDPEERFVAALVRQPARIGALPEEAWHFFLDDKGLYEIYTRALRYNRAEKSIIDGLRQDFPEDARIARWTNEPDIGPEGFEFLLLGIWIRHLDRLWSEARELPKQLEIDRQRRDLQAKREAIHKQINAEG